MLYKLLIKRIFDIVLALLGLIVLAPILLSCYVIASINTNSNGLFVQTRIGFYGKPFKILKIKTFCDNVNAPTSFGVFLRRSKFDELPQLINILNGTMSFVGPRPDIPGYADILVGDDRQILELRPGITGLASLKYRNEEQLLQQQRFPLIFNDEVIWPDKVRINKWYVQNRNLYVDIVILYYTVFARGFEVEAFMSSPQPPPKEGE